MKLKSLELQGFKSFPDKTVITFGSGITAIVGPNGSGKSNISDAVRFVLGEASSKNIRGDKMEDVVFGGTDKRRGMAFAEVSITFDNSDPENRFDVDYDEVTVTRRYEKTGGGSGNSEYMINRHPVRLRDVIELFMNTGLGKSGYSLIGQGRVADIISQKSDERRSIFEEAAGIAKYRYKKEEAEGKLAKVDENLSRASDIIAEVEARLGPLKLESDKAKKYLEVFENKKRADVGLALFDINSLRNSQKEIDSGYSGAKRELDAADNEIASLETQSDKLFLEIQNEKLSGERIVNELKKCGDERHQLETSIGVLENDISHIREQIASTDAENNLRQTELESLQTKCETLKGELESLQTENEAAKNSYESAKKLRDESNAALDSLSKETAGLREELAAVGESALGARLRLSSLEGSGKSEAERRDRLRGELDSLEKSSELLRSRIEKSKGSIADYAEKLTESDRKIKEIDSGRSELITRRDALTDEINLGKLDISSRKQRIDTLRRMEELLEGYSQSVRAVMNASSEGKISGICGPVSRLIKVEGKLGVAIETALGANVQNIVTEDEEAAKSAIAYLKAKNAGRATFYPITTVKGSPMNMDERNLKAYKGYVGIASALVGYDEKYSPVIEYLLGRTVVFDNLDDASVMAKATGYRVRAVTLDGQLINAGGSFTGGSVKRDSGMLTRSAEISRIESEIAKIKITLGAKTSVIDELGEKLGALDSERESEKKTVSLITSLYSAEKTQLEVMKSQRDGEEARMKTLGADYSELASKLESYENERSEIVSEISGCEKRSGELEEAVKALEIRLSEGRAENSDMAEKVSGLLVELTSKQKDLDAAEKAYAFNLSTVESLKEKHNQGEQLIYAANQKLIDDENGLEAAKAGIIRLKEDEKRLDAARSASSERITAAEKRENELKTAERDKTHERELLFREYTRLESKRTALLGDQDKIITKLWDDYELTYSSASELGYPAVTEDNRAEISARQSRLRSELRDIGPVNLGAVDEYREVETRREFMRAQYDDLQKSRDNLTDIIYRLEHEMRERFSSVVEEINLNFKVVFRELFGGGNAELILTEPDNVLESGIEINVAPPGKIIKSLSLLSGGEQAFVAIALFFAILKVNPTPFCILDEIEAALDDVNVQRFAEYCRRCSDKTQFIAITHRRGTMEAADMLYGVTMYEKGVSKLLTLNVSEVEAKIGVRL